MSVIPRIRIMVLHREPLAHVGLRSAFSTHPDFEICHSDESLRSYAADIVVADYFQGLALAAGISEQSGNAYSPKIVVVAASDREWEIRTALERGVHGYVLLGCSLQELVEAVRLVHQGSRYLSPQVAARLADSISLEALTVREEEVLRLVVEGLCNKAVGRLLGIAVGTVKSHLKSTFDKLNVQSRTQAIAAVERRGLLRRSQPINTAPSHSLKSAGMHSPIGNMSVAPSIGI